MIISKLVFFKSFASLFILNILLIFSLLFVRLRVMNARILAIWLAFWFFFFHSLIIAHSVSLSFCLLVCVWYKAGDHTKYNLATWKFSEIFPVGLIALALLCRKIRQYSRVCVYFFFNHLKLYSCYTSRHRPCYYI